MTDETLRWDEPNPPGRRARPDGTVEVAGYGDDRPRCAVCNRRDHRPDAYDGHLFLDPGPKWTATGGLA